jgi:hypothetical protein
MKWAAELGSPPPGSTYSAAADSGAVMRSRTFMIAVGPARRTKFSMSAAVGALRCLPRSWLRLIRPRLSAAISASVAPAARRTLPTPTLVSAAAASG